MSDAAEPVNPKGQKTNPLVLIGGSTCGGKSTLMRAVLASLQMKSIPAAEMQKATTRKPRFGEQDGVDYKFMSEEEFDAVLSARQIIAPYELEGNKYGALVSLLDAFEQRKTVVGMADIAGLRSLN